MVRLDRIPNHHENQSWLISSRPKPSARSPDAASRGPETPSSKLPAPTAKRPSASAAADRAGTLVRSWSCTPRAIFWLTGKANMALPAWALRPRPGTGPGQSAPLRLNLQSTLSHIERNELESEAAPGPASRCPIRPEGRGRGKGDGWAERLLTAAAIVRTPSSHAETSQ